MLTRGQKIHRPTKSAVALQTTTQLPHDSLAPSKAKTKVLTDTAAEERVHEARILVHERLLLLGRRADLEEDDEGSGAGCQSSLPSRVCVI